MICFGDGLISEWRCVFVRGYVALWAPYALRARLCRDASYAALFEFEAKSRTLASVIGGFDIV